jgi:hypothetical protein
MTPELQAFEALLAGLEPAAPALDRDRLMYEAGRASMDAGGRGAWPVATLCVGLVALAVGRWTALSEPQAPAVVERPKEIPAVVASSRPAAAGNSWFALRATVDGDLAVNRRHDEPSATVRPPTATWLEERRTLLEHMN